MDGQIYALELKVIGDDYSEDPHSFVNSVIDFRPQGLLFLIVLIFQTDRPIT